MKRTSYWLDCPYTSRPSLIADIQADVAIVGGGMTGVAIAYFCAKSGLKTVLLEQDTIGSGAIGKSGGMIVDGMEIDLCDAVSLYGPSVAIDMWTETTRARELLIKLITKHSISCGFSQLGSLYVGSGSDDDYRLQQEVAVRKEHALACALFVGEELFSNTRFTSALYNPHDACVNPVQLIRGLIGIAEQYGAKVYEHTTAVSYTSSTVETAQGVVSADRVIVAVESYSPRVENSDTYITTAQAIVTTPIPVDTWNSLGWSLGEMLWTVGDNYISCRKIGERIFSCLDIPTNASDQDRLAFIDIQLDRLCYLFPSLNRNTFSISHEWIGGMVSTRNNRPCIQNRNGYFEIFGHAGNGLTNGIATAKALVDHLLGAPLPHLFIQ